MSQPFAALLWFGCLDLLACLFVTEVLAYQLCDIKHSIRKCQYLKHYSVRDLKVGCRFVFVSTLPRHGECLLFFSIIPILHLVLYLHLSLI